jgi:hypothetical protein
MIFNRYLPYFFKNQAAFKRTFPNSDFADWWIQGGLKEPELKRIVMSKVPLPWQATLRLSDVGHKYRDEKSAQELIDYFSTLEVLDQQQVKMRNSRNDDNKKKTAENDDRYQNDYFEEDYYEKENYD